MNGRIIETTKTLGRNEPCHCNSGKKYKKCCMAMELAGSAKLSAADTALFFRVNMGLLGYVGKVEKKILMLESEKDIAGYQNYTVEMREICWKNPEFYIQKYINENKELGERECAILESWSQKYIIDDFFIMDYTPEYAIVMRIVKEENKAVLYAVKGLTDSLSHVTKKKKPFVAQMILLPFEGKIIYDGLLNPLDSDILINDDEARMHLFNVYNEFLQNDGIVMEL